jgi:hypothetical protein
LTQQGVVSREFARATPSILMDVFNVMSTIDQSPEGMVDVYTAFEIIHTSSSDPPAFHASNVVRQMLRYSPVLKVLFAMAGGTQGKMLVTASLGMSLGPRRLASHPDAPDLRTIATTVRKMQEAVEAFEIVQTRVTLELAEERELFRVFFQNHQNNASLA